MADQIKIEIDVETRAAIAELAKIEKATREVEKETKKLTLAQAAWKAANTDLGQLTKGWKDAGEAVAKVGLAFAGVTAAGLAFAVHVEQQNAAIRRLGASYNAVMVATNGTMSATQALTLQGQIQAAGIQVNERAMAALTRQAREWAIVTGNDTTQAVEKLTNAIVNNSEDALSEMNLSMARGATGAQTLANVVRELEARYRGVAPAARTLREDLEKLPDAITAIGSAAANAAAGGLRSMVAQLESAIPASRQFFQYFSRQGWREIVEAGDTVRAGQQQEQTANRDNARQSARERVLNRARSIGAQISPSQLAGLTTAQLERVERDISAGFGGTASARGDIGQIFAATYGTGGRLGQEAIEGSLGRIRGEMDRASRKSTDQSGYTRTNETDAERIKSTLAKAAANLSGGADAFERMAKAVETAQFAENMREAAQAAKHLANTVVQSREFILTGRDPFVIGGEAGRGEALRLGVGVVGADNVARNRYQSLQSILGLQGMDAEELASASNEIVAAQEGGGLVRREASARTQRRAARDRETRRMAHEQSAAGQMEKAVGLERDEFGNAKAFDMAGGAVNALKETLPVLKSGFSEMFMAIADGSKSAGEAFQEFASKTLTALGQMSINEGIALMFKGAVALVTAPPVAPVYLAAGAGLIALGVGLGAAGAATKPSVPAPGAGASGTQAARGLAPRSSLGSSMGDLGAVTVVQSSLVPAGPVDAQRARDGLRTVRRQGFGDRVPRRIEH